MRPTTLLAAGLACCLGTAVQAETFEQTGAASWYGDRHHGRKTASGELFDMHKVTAAHPKLPLGSLIEVTNLANDKTIQVRVNDRGPFSGHRILDVSKAGAEQLGFIGAGTAKVRIRLVDPSAGELRPKLLAAVPPKALGPEAPAAPAPPAPSESAFVVQVGMFSVRANAERAAQRVAAVGPASVAEDWRSGRVLHRVSLSGWTDRAAAEAARAAVAEAGFEDARVVNTDG